MIARRTITALVGTAVAGLGLVVLAAPAQADTAVVVSGNLTDNGSEWTGATFMPGSVVSSSVTVTITATPGSNDEFYLLADGLLTDVDESRVCVARVDGDDTTWCFLEQGDTYTYAVDPTARNQLVTILVNDTGDQPLAGGFYVSHPSSIGAQTSFGASPAPHIQQFGLPELGTCAEAASDNLNWSGVASGGWGESWAQWINDGDGGFVCTRTLVYNTSQAAWEVE